MCASVGIGAILTRAQSWCSLGHMHHRILIEFVVDVPNADVARDVETRIAREHLPRMCDTLRSITGYEPLRAPDQRGLAIAHEPVTWNAAEQDWIGEDDGDDDEDDDGGDE